MQRGPLLTHQQKLWLNTPITAAAEDLSSLREIGDNKSPRVDGYNTVFFEKAWEIVQNETIVAVLEFFHIGKLYKPMNSTSNTLVPKNVILSQSRSIYL